MMAETATALADALASLDIPVFTTTEGYTRSHQFAIEAKKYGGGQAAARHLRKANILSCGIGLPIQAVQGDMNGLRLGTPEIVRWGMQTEHMPALADLIGRALKSDTPEKFAEPVTEFRRVFQNLHYMRSADVTPTVE